MLRPSYSDLLEVITRDAEDETIGSRYTIVIAAAKRARQLVDNAEPLADEIKVDKPVSIAVQELYEGKIKVRQEYDRWPSREAIEKSHKDILDSIAAEKRVENNKVPAEQENQAVNFVRRRGR